MLVDVENQHSKARVIDKEDHRVTAIGKFIRKVRIDEIPQFWNVVRGDMSLIGPRPEQKGLVNLFNKELTFYSFRHKVRPGMTGLAQIKTSNATDLDATKMKLKYDLYYIKNTSFYLDIYILWRTLKFILSSLNF